MNISELITNNLTKLVEYFKQNFLAVFMIFLILSGVFWKLYAKKEELDKREVEQSKKEGALELKAKLAELLLKSKVDSINAIADNLRRREVLLNSGEESLRKNKQAADAVRSTFNKRKQFDEVIVRLRNDYNDIALGKRYFDDEQYMSKHRKLERELEIAVKLANELNEYKNYKRFFESFNYGFNSYEGRK